MISRLPLGVPVSTGAPSDAAFIASTKVEWKGGGMIDRPEHVTTMVT